jgi:hypothetical protein
VSLLEVKVTHLAWIFPLMYNPVPDRNLMTTPESIVSVCGELIAKSPVTMYGLPANVKVESVAIVPDRFVWENAIPPKRKSRAVVKKKRMLCSLLMYLELGWIEPRNENRWTFACNGRQSSHLSSKS